MVQLAMLEAIPLMRQRIESLYRPQAHLKEKLDGKMTKCLLSLVPTTPFEHQHLLDLNHSIHKANTVLAQHL